MMNKLSLILGLILLSTQSFADQKISQMPTEAASSVISSDYFPMVDTSSIPLVNRKVTLWDLVNLPPFVSTYATLISPTFTGTIKLANLQIATNTLSSTNTNGNIRLAPNGAGYVNFGTNASGAFPGLNNGTYIGSNFNTGQAEVDFWNSQTGASNSFAFYQQTGTSAATKLLNIDPTGVPTWPVFGTGLFHSSSAGVTSSSLLVNADITNSTIDLTTKVTGVLPNANTTAASANTASAIVTRDSSGNFIAGTISAALSGNSTTSTTTTNITGGAAGSIPYQTGSGATTLLATSTGVLVGGSTPSYSTAPTLTGTNFSGTAASLTAGNVTTNASLTGPITSVGNATSIASQTGTGSKFVVATSPSFTTSILPDTNYAINTGTDIGSSSFLWKDIYFGHQLITTGVQPTSVSTTPATAADAFFNFTPAIGGNTTIATTGAGGVGSGLSVTAGVGGTAASATTASTGGGGGAVLWTAGKGGAAAVSGTGTGTGGAGGQASLFGATGGAATGASSGLQLGGNGGQSKVNGGTGGAANTGTANNTGGVGGLGGVQGGPGGVAGGTGTGTNTSGAGGLINIIPGAGGNVSAAITGTNQAGTSGLINISGSGGGTASGASVANLGGNGSAISMFSGAGGAATGTGSVGGNSGTITIQTGIAGTGSTTNGTVGSLLLGTNATTYLTIDGSGNTTLGGALNVSGGINSSAAQTVVNCATSGTVTYSQPLQGSSYKKVIAYAAACLGAAAYTYPTAFSHTPSAVSTNGLATTLFTSTSTSAVTLTGTSSTGFLFLEGF